MPLDASWTDALPEVTDHPAIGVTVAPAQQAAPDASWAAALPEVLNHPAATPEPATAPAGHAVAGPSGDLLTDIGRRASSAAINAGVGLVSPLISGASKPSQYPAADRLSAAAASPFLKAFGITSPPATTSQEAQDNAFNALHATEYQPETLGGKMVQSGLSSAMMGAANPSTIPALFGGGMTSELAATLAPEHPTIARMLGFLPGAYAAKGITNLPFKPAGGSMDTETANLANAATNTYGVPLAAGQISGNPFIRYFYSEAGKLPFSGAEKFGGTQQGAFNKAVSQTFGEDAEKITPEVMQAAKSRIGGVFNDVASRTSVNADTQFVNDLAHIESNAPLVLTAQEWTPISKQIDNVLSKVQPGDTISGDAYQALTRKGTPLDLAVNSSNPNLRQWAGQLRTSLDDALQRSASPADLAALKQARSQWKAMRTVEPLTLRSDATGGATPSTGDISPAALRAVVNRSYGNAAFAPLGQIELNDLAKIGQRFLKEPPDSGTATRNIVQHGLGAAGAAGAAGASIMAGHEAGLSPLTSAGTTAAALLANRMAQGALRSPWLANRQIQASMNPNGLNFGMPSLPQSAPTFLLPGQQLPFGWALPDATGANSGTGR